MKHSDNYTLTENLMRNTSVKLTVLCKQRDAALDIFTNTVNKLDSINAEVQKNLIALINLKDFVNGEIERAKHLIDTNNTTITNIEKLDIK